MVPEPCDVGLVPTPRTEPLRCMLPEESLEPEVPEVPEVPDVDPTGAQSRLVDVPEVVAPLALPLDAVAPLAPDAPVEPPVRVPDKPLVPVGPLTVPAGQSELAPAADVPWVLDEPVIPVDPVPALFVPLEPLGAPDVLEVLEVLDAGELGSTLLPVPRVAELTPDAPGVELCALASPAEQSKAAINAADTCFFMTTPEKKYKPCSFAKTMPSRLRVGFEVQDALREVRKVSRIFTRLQKLHRTGRFFMMQ
jgi:hypothetical protein